MSKKVGQPGSYCPVPQKFQQPHILYSPTDNPQRPYQFIPKRSDVGFSVSGNNSNRALGAQPQYTSVSGPHPGSNSTALLNSQNNQLRGLQSSAPHHSTHSPLSSSGGPHSSSPHSQHHPVHHSVAPQQQHHHPSLSSTAVVSGPSGPVVNLVQSNVTPGISSSPAGPAHELNAQGVQQTSPQTLPPGAGVALTGSVAGPPSMMFPTGNHSSHPQAAHSSSQLFQYAPAPSTPALLHAGGQPRPAIPHQQQNVSGYPYIMPPPAQIFHQYPHMMHRQNVVGNQQPFQHLPQGPPFPPMGYSLPGGGTPVYYSSAAQSKAPPTPAPHTQRVRHIIPIIDPDTHANILDEISTQPSSKPSYSPSPVLSRDSSASNTPAPGESLVSEPQSLHIRAEFARLAVISDSSHPTLEESVNNSLSDSKNVHSSPPSVLMSDREKERLTSSVCHKNEINNQSVKIVPPEQINDKSVKVSSSSTTYSPSNDKSAMQLPPPQPQRPPKQPKHVQSVSPVNQSNSGTANPQAPILSQPISTKQASPTQVKNNQSYTKPVGSTQNTKFVAQQNKDISSALAGSPKLNAHSCATEHQQQVSKQNIEKCADSSAVTRAITHKVSSPQIQQVSQLPTPQKLHDTSKSQTSLTQSGPLPASVEASAKIVENPPTVVSAKSDKIVPQSAIANSKEKIPISIKDDLVVSKKEISDPAVSVNGWEVFVSNNNLKNRTLALREDIHSDKCEVSSTDAECIKERPSKRKRGRKNAGKEKKTDLKENTKDSTEVPKPVDDVKILHEVRSANKSNASSASTTDKLPVESSTSQPSKNIEVECNQLEEASTKELSPTKSTGEVEESLSESLPVHPQIHHNNNINVPKENHLIDSPTSSLNESGNVIIPDCPDGKLQYDRDFLLELRDNPISSKRPDFLPDIEVVLSGPINRQVNDLKVKMLSDFTPAFLQNANNRGRGLPYGNTKMANRNNQQNKKVQRIIDIKLTSNADVKLKTTKNAWKPTPRAVDEVDNSDAQVKHDKTIKKMRGILNKLTPDNFDKLVVQVKALNVEKHETFDELIEIVFEKAVDEQAFSSTYAELCKVLSQMSLKSQENGDENMFKKSIITKCQKEFEKDSKAELRREEREKKIAQTTDWEEKEELLAILTYDEMQLRRRSVGNIRFIGELYKRQMLTSQVMMRIIQGLLLKADEESLECLCKLITTVGQIFDSNAMNSNKSNVKDDWNTVFNDIRNLVRGKSTSSRVRFLMMDVLDLKYHNWIPRREQANPKSKAQVHEEIRKEEIEQQLLLSNTPRRDDRDIKKRGLRDNRGGSTPLASEDAGWNIVNARRGPFDSSRLKNNTFNINRHSNVDSNVVLKAPFSNWARGSSGGAKDEDENLRPVNRYALLENHNQFSLDIRRSNTGPRFAPGSSSHPHHGMNFGSKSMPGPSEKENLSNKGDRSKSNSRTSSRDSSLARESRYDVIAVLDRNIAEKYTVSILEEFALNSDLKEAVECILERFKGKNIMQFVHCTLAWVGDREENKRKKVGVLLHHLLSHKILSVHCFIEGSREVLEMMPDSVIDVPQLYSNMGEVLSHLLVFNVFTINDLLKTVEPAGSGMVPIFTEIVKQISKQMDKPVVIGLWKKSGLSWSSILPSDISVNDYLTKHGLEFFEDTSVSINQGSTGKQSLDLKIVREELCKLFRSQASEDEIFEWIGKNIGEETNTIKFVRALTTALIESLLVGTGSDCWKVCDDFERILGGRVNYVKKYVDNKPDLELQCLFAMQALMVEYQFPNKLLERCFFIFHESDVLSEESFLEWEKDENPDEQMGKGVCLNSVRQFLGWIKSTEST